MITFRYDTQLLIEGENLSEDDIRDYILEHFEGDCLLAGGRRGTDQTAFSYQLSLADPGILCFAGRDL